MATDNKFVMAKRARTMWPAMIVTPDNRDPPPPNDTAKFVFFFHTQQCDWINASDIKEYDENAVEKSKAKGMKKAHRDLRDYKSDPTKFSKNVERIQMPLPVVDIKVEKMEATNSNVPILQMPSKNAEPMPIKKKKMVATNANNNGLKTTFGFLLGFFEPLSDASKIINFLLDSNRDVVIWVREVPKVKGLKKGASFFSDPFEVLKLADMIFSSLCDSRSVEELAKNQKATFKSKSYIQICNVEDDERERIVEYIESNGGRYLEALQVVASNSHRNLNTLAAGDENLFNECEFIFKAISLNAFYLGTAGNAMAMHLVIQPIASMYLIVLADSLNLAKELGLPQKYVITVLEKSSICSPNLIKRGEEMAKNGFQPKDTLLQSINKWIFQFHSKLTALFMK